MSRQANVIATRGYRNKNPLNIRYSVANNWHGQLGKDSEGFCRFEAFTYGIRAAVLILKKYISRGDNTIEKIIYKWAPPYENNTVQYARFVSKKTSIPCNKPISIYDRTKIMAIIDAMIRMECAGLELQKSWISVGYDLAITDKEKVIRSGEV